MKNIATIAAALTAGVLSTQPLTALACVFEVDNRPAFVIRAKSKPVEVDSQCGTINAGVYDRQSLGPAVDLNKGRIYQSVDEREWLALLGDCNTREVIVLLGPVKSTVETSCGPSAEFVSIIEENAPFSLSAGKDLHELVDIATKHGAKEVNPNERFFEFTKDWAGPRKYKVGRKDRFDLLCGCKIHYPDSPGAKS